MPSGTPSRRLPAPANGGGAQTRLLPFRPSWGGCFRGDGKDTGCIPRSRPGALGQRGGNVYFCQQWVRARCRAGGRASWPRGSLGSELPPFPSPPQTSHHSGSAWERTERARLTGPRFQSALRDVPNKNVDFWGRDHGPEPGQ